MKVELFQFQSEAVRELRAKTAEALGSYQRTGTPQVISLQAPTGSGKTIIMASLIEDIYHGTDSYAEQPEAIFVWLSDSPGLNEQSKQKLELKADKLVLGQCITIEDASFDQEMLADGHIYFLNTQKLGTAGNLSHHSDSRQYTIWETLEKTARQKADHLYFIIDEAHRGMQGRAAGKANSIMQRFLKGSKTYNLSPMPIVIGMSATAERFNKLVGNTSSTLQKVLVSTDDVRASGLLKDRIIITYPDDVNKHNDMVVLQAATDEWLDKCQHWQQYTQVEHCDNVNPIFLIQVKAGSGEALSDTNLEDVLAKIEERCNQKFQEYEVVHTFGSTGDLVLNGLTVPHVQPENISDDQRIRIVFFKENLSTGWDCPRAETMMSFRHAEDATYIAQLLGRMIRTPLQAHIFMDDTLNDVHLYLPYFNADTVKSIVDELQNSEGEDIPAVVDEEELGSGTYQHWTVRPVKKKTTQTDNTSMPSLFDQDSLQKATQSTYAQTDQPDFSSAHVKEHGLQNNNSLRKMGKEDLPAAQLDRYVEDTMFPELDREKIIQFINHLGLLTYTVRYKQNNDYRKSLFNLASLLTTTGIYKKADNEIKEDILQMIHHYNENLRLAGKYERLSKKVMELRLSSRVFDVFGERQDNQVYYSLFTSDSDLDRQLREANAKLGSHGYPDAYIKRFLQGPKSVMSLAVDCILFVNDENNLAQLTQYAKDKFHALDDQYRRYLVNKSESCQKQYNTIISNGDRVSKHNFMLPEQYEAKAPDKGKAYRLHLFVDDKTGVATFNFNSWEEGILQEEAKRPDFLCWLRNPERKSWSLTIPYYMNNTVKAMYPDFLIVRHDPAMEYVVDILEPHDPTRVDNLPKAKGMAHYVKEEPRIGRVQLIRKMKDGVGNSRFCRLDLGKGEIRDKVLAATTNIELDHIFDVDGFFAEA